MQIEPTSPGQPLRPLASAVQAPGPAAPPLMGDALSLTRPPAVARIDQMHPAGADRGYTNGFSNCGPTSMAMVTRAFGRGGDLTDAQLITHMAKLGGTTKDGSSPDSIVKMAKGVGLAATVHGPGPDLAWIDQQLASGKLVVAHGNYFGLPPHDQEKRTWKGGHFLVVAGRAAGGGYMLRDPLDGKVGVVSREDLTSFIGSHPSHGHQIAVGPA